MNPQHVVVGNKALTPDKTTCQNLAVFVDDIFLRFLPIIETDTARKASKNILPDSTIGLQQILS
jgi:hypothetical protein